jgi:hypothetical protein
MRRGNRSEGRSAAMSGSDRSEAFAPDAAAIPQNGPAALRRIAAQKAVLPPAANLRRLILTFHAIPRFKLMW